MQGKVDDDKGLAWPVASGSQSPKTGCCVTKAAAAPPHCHFVQLDLPRTYISASRFLDFQKKVL